VIRIEGSIGDVMLLLAETEKTLDGGAAVRPVLPLAAGAPLELGGFGRSTLTPLATGVAVAVI
jgi:hypothetical protein